MIRIRNIFVGIMIFMSSVANANEQTPEVKKYLESIKVFSTVFMTAQALYVDEISTEELFEKAIVGMMAGLDPHSVYMSKEEKKSLKENSKGEFGGLGIVVTSKDEVIEVISPIDDTPAFRQGIKAGDKIIKIDEKSSIGMKLSDAVKLMRGVPGTDIVVTVVRKGETPKDIRITREIIKVESVKSVLLDGGIGYARVSSFQQKTTKSLKAQIQKMIIKNKGFLNGMVLDLRNNPGGLLSASIGVSDLFLDKGKKVVFTKGRIASSLVEHYADEEDLLCGVPMVVLVNEGSASASEIVSGALQDHARAIIMGRKTFGKGSVQTVIDLNEDRGMKITTARYYTPDGRSIQAKGIVPDIELKNIDLSKVNEDSVITTTEAQLGGHLESELEKSKLITNTPKTASEEKRAKELESDYYVVEARNVIKALSIASSRNLVRCK